MDLGVIISCCMSNPCPGWWEGGQKTNHRTNMDIETRCNDFTLLRNDHLVVCWQGKHTAPHGDERRHEQLSQEESNVLIWTSHERGTNTRVTWVWFLQIHNVLQSQDHPTQKFTRSHWCCLKQTFKKKKKKHDCVHTTVKTHTDTHTHTHTHTQCMSCSVSSFLSSAPGNVLNQTSLCSRPPATEKHFLCATTQKVQSVCEWVSTTD